MMNVLNHPHPGETLRDQVIEPLHMTVSEAAQKLGMSRPALSRVLNGKAGISSDLAIRLEMAGISTARFWTSLQAQQAFKAGPAAAAGTRRAGAAR
jgi:addiction module HigA family antidote